MSKFYVNKKQKFQKFGIFYNILLWQREATSKGLTFIYMRAGFINYVGVLSNLVYVYSVVYSIISNTISVMRGGAILTLERGVSICRRS